jgi:hypothetical protein
VTLTEKLKTSTAPAPQVDIDKADTAKTNKARRERRSAAAHLIPQNRPARKVAASGDPGDDAGGDGAVRKYLRKWQVSKRYGGITSRSIDRAVRERRFPRPVYMLGSAIPFWEISVLDAARSGLAATPVRIADTSRSDRPRPWCSMMATSRPTTRSRARSAPSFTRTTLKRSRYSTPCLSGSRSRAATRGRPVGRRTGSRTSSAGTRPTASRRNL